MTGAAPPRVNPAWIAARQALHARFVEVCQPPDASWLGHLGLPERRWSLEDVADLWRGVPTQPGRLAPVNHVYVHVPFCKSICSFCNYERLRPTSPELLRRWRDRVLHALEVLEPALAGHTFHSVYVGGGTPSVLPAAMVTEVMGALDAHLRIHPAARRAFELDPAILSPDRLEAWRRSGFTRASFGVQTLDASVNIDHNRGAQDRALVGRRFEQLRQAGVSEVSVDFLLGLAGTTPDGIFAEIERVLIEHRPRWVDVFLLTPTRAYLETHFDGDQAAFFRHLAPFQAAAAPRLTALASRTGYALNLGDGHHHNLYNRDPVRADPSAAVSDHRFTYCQSVSEQGRPLSLLGLGTSARSRLFGRAWVEFRDPDDDVGATGAAWFRGSAVTSRDEALEYAIFSLRDGDSLDTWSFEALFGQSVEACFPQALAAWASSASGAAAATG